ncbi:kinesin-like protein KIF3B [Dysidea avara]|uniref:kinesin-like protein KIF3B n=1 Tax=Dysidea avara TaxID=196820 RepID=UPI003317C3C7
MAKKSESVKVVVRCRPMSEQEIASNYERVVDMDVARGMVIIKNPNSTDSNLRDFTFDAVYDWNSKQKDLYDETFRPIVESVLEGYNGTIFAYGQTGTGKTYTMEGIRSDAELKGVIPNAFDHIFIHIQRTENEQFLVRASYLEIYQEAIRDLLSKDQQKRLELRERPDSGVYVEDLSSFVAKNVKEIERVMSVGNQNRSVGRTDMNEHSSRSHAIFIVTVECCKIGVDGKDHIRVGKLNLVDLAGSERQSKTGTTGERFKEATKINLSLSALGNVISALVDGKSSHIPYRDSKLTRLLQDSLGGNSKTCMVANVGPASYNYDETLTTIRYANRAKNIKNKPIINEDPKDALLREFQEELLRLKSALEKRKKKGSKKRHKTQQEGDSEGESDEGEENTEGNLKVEQERLEAERQSILQNKELLEEEREKLVSGVQERANQLKKEQKKQEVLASKIKAMESKLLAGTKSIVDKTDQQQIALEQQKQEMIEQKKRERTIQQQLLLKEESTLEAKENYSSLQEEVEVKTKKLNKLKSRLKVTKAEIVDMKSEQAKVREELAISLEELQRDLKLRSVIVDNFIPPEEVEMISSRAEYDEETERWSLIPTSQLKDRSQSWLTRPVSGPGGSSSRSGSSSLRHMYGNVLQVELDMPNRTTRDYEPSSAGWQAVLDDAFKDEEEITIQVSSNDFFLFTDENRPKAKRKKQKLQKMKSDREFKTVTAKSKPDDGFPTSRGLVSSSIRYA